MNVKLLLKLKLEEQDKNKVKSMYQFLKLYVSAYTYNCEERGEKTHQLNDGLK